MSRRPPHAPQRGADVPLCVRLAVAVWCWPLALALVLSRTPPSVGALERLSKV